MSVRDGFEPDRPTPVPFAEVRVPDDDEHYVPPNPGLQARRRELDDVDGLVVDRDPFATAGRILAFVLFLALAVVLGAAALTGVAVVLRVLWHAASGT